MIHHLTKADYIAAAVPISAIITLDQINGVIAAIGGILGIAYLLWKWRREARKPGSEQ